MTDERKDRMVQAIMAELPDTHCFVLILAPLGVPDKLGVATILYSANPPDIPLVLETDEERRRAPARDGRHASSPPMKWIITIESEERMSIEAWKALRSHVDFVLARHCPHAHTFIDIKDTFCPRQEKPLRAEDMI